MQGRCRAQGLVVREALLLHEGGVGRSLPTVYQLNHIGVWLPTMSTVNYVLHPGLVMRHLAAQHVVWA